MSHISEGVLPLSIRRIEVRNLKHVHAVRDYLHDVVLVVLPPVPSPKQVTSPLPEVGRILADWARELPPLATFIVVGEIGDLVNVQVSMSSSVRYQHWIAIKRQLPLVVDKARLPHQHFGALVYTRYKQSLRHTRTRIEYTYCPACDRTTKDYGGKKHTYNERGTLISDVWRDVAFDLEGDLDPLIQRFADLFGIEPYTQLNVIDCREASLQRSVLPLLAVEPKEMSVPPEYVNRIVHGDCLEVLQKVPDNSVDFAFADPPYNLSKKYLGYSDDLDIQDYFMWCDKWIKELARVLKPGRTLALLNIPLWAVRHFLFMQTILEFQNWIVWDALAYPVRLIMPSHYAILCFSKGKARELPGLSAKAKTARPPSAPTTFDALRPLADTFCLRSQCVETRLARRINDRTVLTDAWGDIHRLKHNSRRVDHPCQLPPHLMYRLIEIFTWQGEFILDCFNGAGTTTLTAHQLGRHYLGIDASEKYCAIAQERHDEIARGLDPFRKEERMLTSKNSPVPRLQKQVYKVPKKVLQLEVRQVAKQLGHLPSRDELIQHGKYPIEYYDDYFASWGEVCAAARNTGMSDRRVTLDASAEDSQQLAFSLEM
ncbi:MAG: DNA methyltransferase [Anaerolineae bacterium]